MNSRRARVPLYVKFLVPILLTVLVSSLTVMTVLIRREGARLRTALRDKGETLARYLSYNAEFGVLAQDRETLQSLAEMALKVKEITRAEIRGRDQTLLATAVKEGVVPDVAEISIAVPVVTQRVARRKEEIGLSGDEAGPAKAGGGGGSGGGEEFFLDEGEGAAPAETPASEEIGLVAVRLSTREVDAAVIRARNMVIGMTAVSVVILSGVLVILVRFITNPVKRLVQATNRIAGGDLTETVETGQGDELGVLAASFNVMVGNLKRSMESLHRTSDFSQAMVPPRDMDTLLRVITDRFERAGAPGGVGIFLAAGEEGMRFASGSEHFSGLEISRDAALPARVREGEEILVVNRSEAWTTALADRGIGFLVPLRSSESLVGLVAVGGTTPPEENLVELLLTFASIGAMAIESMRLSTMRTENEILRRELAFAHEIQMRLLPSGVPDMEGFEIHPLCMPARELGGDYYDFIPLDGGKRLGVTVADVAGKGVPAALFMASSRSFLRAEAEKHPSPGLVLTSINRLLHADMKDRTFVSMFYGVFDLAEMKLEYANAGHLFPFLVRRGEGQGAYLKTSGLPLGITGSVAYATETIDLRQGDLIVCYTDGLIEAMNASRELFGFERFEQAMGGMGESGPQAVVNNLMGEVRTFTDGVSLADDLTIIALRVS